MANNPNWRLDDDKKTVTVTFPTEPPVALKLDSREIDAVLKTVGELRAAMVPEHTRELSKGKLVSAVYDPNWATGLDPLGGNSRLHIRDPRFGWLHYVIPRDEARKLAGFLRSQVNSPTLKGGSSKAN